MSGNLTQVFGAITSRTESDSIDLSLGGLIGVSELDQLVTRVFAIASNAPLTQYPGTQGTDDFLSAYCALRALENAPTNGVESVVSTHGALDGLGHALIAYGAEQVAYFVPGFDIGIAARRAGCIARPIPWGIDDSVGLLLERLEEFCSSEKGKIAVVVHFPSNPAGRIPTQDEWNRLIEIVNRSGFLLISDEVYRFTVDKPSWSIDDCENAIVVDSLSKRLGVPGLRLGVNITNSTSLRDAMCESLGRHCVGVSTLVATFGTNLISGYAAEPDIAELVRDTLQERRDILSRGLEGYSHYLVQQSQGLYSCIELKDQEQEESFKAMMLEKGRYIVTPSSALVPQAIRQKSFVRLCIGAMVHPGDCAKIIRESLRKIVGPV